MFIDQAFHSAIRKTSCFWADFLNPTDYHYWYSVDFFKSRVLHVVLTLLTNCLHTRAGQHSEAESTDYH